MTLEHPPAQSITVSMQIQQQLVTTPEQPQLEPTATTEPPMPTEQVQVQSAIPTELVSQATTSVERLNQVSAEAVPRSPTPPVRVPSPLPNQVPPRPLNYDDPRAIYQRYVIARDAWYRAQPPGTYVNNQLYRKAVGLPARYNKASYEWCLDYKQMTKRCVTSEGSRDWTREEMMAYLDWDRLEDNRVDARVALELKTGLREEV